MFDYVLLREPGGFSYDAEIWEEEKNTGRDHRRGVIHYVNVDVFLPVDKIATSTCQL